MGFENKGSNQNDSKDLFTMNRSLTQTIDSLEQRVKLFELKNQRLKNYKKIVSSSTIFRCSKCADFYSPQLFFDHVQNCFNYSNCSASPNTITSKDEVIKFDSAFKSNNELKLNSLVKINNKQDEKNKYLINQKLFSMGSFVENTPKIGKVRAELESLQEVDNRKNELKVSIRQTNVQNGEDKKPFTEYTIFCSLKRVKWRVTKKYVNFCQLHQELAMQYPNLNLKYSAYIVSNVSNFGGLFDPNKPMVLEEKRKGLENYLIEIASNEILKNSESFKKFLLIDDAVKKFSEPTKYSTPVQKSQEKIKDEKSVFISEKKNTDYSLIEKDNIACIPSLLEYANEKITISHNNDIFTISDVESSDKSSVLVLRF